MKIILFICLLFAWHDVSAKHHPAKHNESATEKWCIMRLEQLGYWADTNTSPQSPENHQAIIAFQKVNGLNPTGKLSDSMTFEITYFPMPAIKEAMHRNHLEVDLDRQVLFLIDSADQVLKILPVSSGDGKEFDSPGKKGRVAITPTGNFKVQRKISGWKKSDLGLMYDPLYISGGIAIHGSNSVPPEPASHGCIRIPMFAAPILYEMIPVGTPVIVYGKNPNPPTASKQ